MKHFSSEMNPFRAESAPIIADWRWHRRSVHAPARVRALSITGLAGGKAPGANSRFPLRLRL